MSQEDLVKSLLNENFERLRSNLENLRSMLQDLVLAVPSVPDSAKMARAIIESMPSEEPQEAPPPPEAVKVPTPALNNGLLYHMANIEYANSQSDVLNRLLKGIEDYAQRGVLFVVRNDSAQAWNAFGFERIEEAKRWKASLDSDPLLRTVVGSRTRMLMEETVPGFIQDEQAVRRSLISPLLLKGKVMAFLYADSGQDGALDHYSIDVLIRTASLAIDIFPLRPKRDPLPPVLENQDIILAGPAPIAAPGQEEPLLFDDTGSLTQQAEGEDLPAAQTMMAQIPVVPEPEPPEPVEAEPALEDSGASPRSEPMELDSAEYERPSPVALEETAPPEPEPEPEADEPIPPSEQKAHADAERFARLLVQEVALYHPREMEQGKRDGNLAALLRDDIERSREAYENRFQSPSIKARDYFNKALVRYLADGDASLLGL